MKDEKTILYHFTQNIDLEWTLGSLFFRVHARACSLPVQIGYALQACKIIAVTCIQYMYMYPLYVLTVIESYDRPIRFREK